MSETKGAFLNNQLSKRTVIFGLRLWVVLGICVGAAIVLVLFLISLYFMSRRNNKVKNIPKTNLLTKNGTISSNMSLSQTPKPTIPNISKEITEIRLDNSARVTLPDPVPETGHANQRMVIQSQIEDTPVGHQRIHIEIGKDHRISYPDRVNGSASSHGSGEQFGLSGPEVSHLGWGHWYTLRELEESTNGFADENVIGEGGYGIVYHGILDDNTHVAVKNLLNNRFCFSLILYY